jgi:hypothetical protein
MAALKILVMVIASLKDVCMDLESVPLCLLTQEPVMMLLYPPFWKIDYPGGPGFTNSPQIHEGIRDHIAPVKKWVIHDGVRKDDEVCKSLNGGVDFDEDGHWFTKDCRSRLGSDGLCEANDSIVQLEVNRVVEELGLMKQFAMPDDSDESSSSDESGDSDETDRSDDTGDSDDSNDSGYSISDT